MISYVGGVEQRKKHQSTFFVVSKLWFHSDKHIWVLLSWTQKMLRVEVWGPFGTLVKEEGSIDLASDYGAQRTCL